MSGECVYVCVSLCVCVYIYSFLSEENICISCDKIPKKKTGDYHLFICLLIYLKTYSFCCMKSSLLPVLKHCHYLFFIKHSIHVKYVLYKMTLIFCIYVYGLLILISQNQKLCLKKKQIVSGLTLAKW